MPSPKARSLLGGRALKLVGKAGRRSPPPWPTITENGDFLLATASVSVCLAYCARRAGFALAQGEPGLLHEFCAAKLDRKRPPLGGGGGGGSRWHVDKEKHSG